MLLSQSLKLIVTGQDWSLGVSILARPPAVCYSTVNTPKNSTGLGMVNRFPKRDFMIGRLSPRERVAQEWCRHLRLLGLGR